MHNYCTTRFFSAFYTFAFEVFGDSILDTVTTDFLFTITDGDSFFYQLGTPC